MKVSANLIIEIDNLQISEDLGRGDKLTEDIFITNNKSTIRNLIEHVDLELQKAIGLIAYNSLANSSVCVYRKLQYDTDEYNSLDLLDEHISYIHGFSDIAWLIKDNSINLGDGYLLYVSNDNLSISRNHFYISKSKCNSTVDEINLNRSELRIIRQAFNHYAGNSESSPKKFLDIYDKRNSRFSRVFYLIHLTRSTKNIASKMINYSSCFETLLTNSNMELSHQIAERVAFLIGSSTNNKLEIYHNLKKAYNYRSRIIHGGSLKEKELDELKKLILVIDEYLRKVLTILLTDIDRYNKIFNDPESLDDYFLSLIFK